jgi:hypothetical protein
VWSKLDEREPPGPTTEETTFSRVVGAAVLEAATMAAIAAVAHRASARVFHYLTGYWPGEKIPEKTE